MADAPLHYQTITEVAERIRSREISPVELTRMMLDRIAARDGELKSYATVMAEPAMAAARAAEAEIAAGRYRGSLHGVPIAVKDLCFTTGVATMGGAQVLRDFVPDFDATVVRKLNDAGAIILGKLNLTEGAMAGYNPAFEIPINPWGADRWAGASSSGSGVATAAGPVLRLAGQRHGRVDTVSGGGVRHGGHQADLGKGESVRSAGTGGVAGPRRSHDPQRGGRPASCCKRWRDTTPTIRRRCTLAFPPCCRDWARVSRESASAWTNVTLVTMWTATWPRRC